MSSINLKPRQQRTALETLAQDRLKDLLDHFELEVEDRRRKDDCVNALVRSRKLTFEDVLRKLKRDELKEICRALNLDDGGRSIEPIIKRILAIGSEPDGQGSFQLTSPEPKKSKKGSTARTSRSPKKQSATSSDILSYRHDDRRKNNPHVGLVTPTTDPEASKTTWAYDPHIDPTLQFDVRAPHIEKVIDEALETDNVAKLRDALTRLKNMSSAYLNWAGKAERTSFEVDTVSLHVHERIDPMSILSAVRKRERTKDKRSYHQPGLFDAPFENLPLRDAIDFYKHDKGWSNRLVAGDSLLVMNSLLQKEGMAGQVQMVYIDPPYGIKYGSNFQPFVHRRDVKDRKDQDLTQEPEMIKAFRDTWELGLHSYLSYLRDRIKLSHELLTQSGSIFVQISDENSHHVREILDEIFGPDNFCSQIVFRKTTGTGSQLLDGTYDLLLWYGKDKSNVKYNPLFEERVIADDANLRLLEEPDGHRRRMTKEESRGLIPLPEGAKAYRPNPITNQRPAQGRDLREFEFEGQTFTPGSGTFRTDAVGLRRAARARRLVSVGKTLAFVRYLDDFAYKPRNNIWDDTRTGGFVEKKVYVVQTGTKVVERCLLMTTDPGDLVFDPTCGSGTTAYAAERWGRRWITCDTSRVAITLAKQRLLTSCFDYYALRYPHEGLKGGFVYDTVPHVKLKAITNNAEIDEIYDRAQPELDKAVEKLNASLLAAPSTLRFSIGNGSRKGQTIDLSAGDLLHLWEIPYRAPDDWPKEAIHALEELNAIRRSTQAAIDLSIQSGSDQAVLVERATVDTSRLRVTGPFTVEAVPFPAVSSLEAESSVEEETVAVARSGSSAKHHQWLDELLRTGIRGKGGQILRIADLETQAGTQNIHASGSLADDGARVLVSFGPEHAPLEQRQVALALNEAEKLRPTPSYVVFCAFNFDPEAAKDIDETRWPGVTLLKAQMNTDLLTEDLKTKRASNQSFWLMGQPDVELRQRSDDSWEVEVLGFDYFNTSKGELISGGKKNIAVWMLDTDYDERSLVPSQVFFPMAGRDTGWSVLSKDVRATLNEPLLNKFNGTLSLPFQPGDNKRVAVKLVDDRGIESLKILPFPTR